MIKVTHVEQDKEGLFAFALLTDENQKLYRFGSKKGARRGRAKLLKLIKKNHEHVKVLC